MNATNIRMIFEEVINTEISCLQKMVENLDDSFQKAISIIRECSGRVIVIGMGKSGIIGKKIAATFASTGTSSFFVHPGEAFHGDLGMIGKNDVLLLISYSGETEELIRLIPFLKWQENKIISITGGLDSTLARNSDVVLNVRIEKEACTNNLAPTSSTTATLVMGDALAVTLSTLKNFQPEDFARFHPGGNLGRRLLTRVQDVMHKRIPRSKPKTKFLDIAKAITDGRLGLTVVMDGDELLGIITDGDLRRSLENFEKPFDLLAEDIMTKFPKLIESNRMLTDAEIVMKESKVSSLIVTEKSQVVGVLQLLDGL